MPGSKIDLLFHPVRIQIITTISTHRMTTQEIASVMSDIPLTTLYRHIHALVEGGILKVVEENPIRGTVERVYTVGSPPLLTADDLRGMSKQDYEQAFTTYLSTLMSDARQYLNSKPDDEEIDLLKDGVQLNKIQLYLDEEEYQQVSTQIQEIIMAAAQKEPRPGRRRRMVTWLFIPSGS